MEFLGKVIKFENSIQLVEHHFRIMRLRIFEILERQKLKKETKKQKHHF